MGVFGRGLMRPLKRPPNPNSGGTGVGNDVQKSQKNKHSVYGVGKLARSVYSVYTQLRGGLCPAGK